MKILDILEFQGNIASKMVLDTYTGATSIPASSEKAQIFYADANTAATSITPVSSTSNSTGVYVPTGSGFLRLDNIYNTVSDILSNTGRGILLNSYTPAAGDIIRWDATGKLTGTTILAFNQSLTLKDLSDTIISGETKGQVLIWNGTADWVNGTIEGTANQVLVDLATTGKVKLSLPQDIATISTPTFQGLNVLYPTGPATATIQSTAGNARLNVFGQGDAFISVGDGTGTKYGGFNYDVDDARLNIGVSTNTVNGNPYGPTSISIYNVASASATRGAPIEFGSFIKLMGSINTSAETAYYINNGIYKDTNAAGLMYFETGTKAIKFYDGTAWQSLLYGSGGGYVVNITAGSGISVSGTSTIKINSLLVEGAARGLTIVAGNDGAANTITLAQDIRTTASPTFAGLIAPSITLTGQVITASATPSIATDVITLDYFQKQSFGTRDFKESVLVATVAPLPANGVVGGVITDSSTGSVLTIDGLALTAANGVVANKTRVLVKDQATPAQNGIYVVTQIGVAGTTKWILTRTSDFNTMSGDVTGVTLPNITNGAYVFVGSGSTLSKTGWVVNDADSALTTINTSNINFIQFTGAGSILGTANRITVVGNVVDIASNYVGQATITTLGTITTGVWNGTTIAITNGGTGATTAIAAFNNLSPLTTLGDILSRDASNNVRIAGNITTTKQFLSSTGTGTVSALPAWSVLAAADIPNLDAGKITSGTLPVARGGTGLASYTVGSILYASAATTIAGLADVATGNVLISGGVGVAPSWGKVGLTTHVSGILPFANGGTGIGSSAGAADAGKTIVLNAAGDGFVLSTNAVGRNQKIAWNPSTPATAATQLTVGPYINSYQYVVAHTLASSTVEVSIIDNTTGEVLLCTYFATATLNTASPTYANTSNITLKFSAAGWATISAKTSLSILLTAM